MAKRIKNEFKDIYMSEENLVKNWTYQEFLKNKDKELQTPIYIRSHKRPDAPSINLLKDYKGKKLISIYSDQEEIYAKWREFGFELVLIDPSKQHASINSNASVLDAINKGNGKLIIMDDDMFEAFVGVEGKTAAGKYCTFKKKVDFVEMLKSWEQTIENYKKEWSWSGIVHANSAQWVDIRDKEDTYTKDISLIMQIFMINTREWISNNLRFKDENTWEDFDFTLQSLSKGLNTPVVSWLSYSCENMNENNSQLDAHKNIEDKNYKLSHGFYNTWGPKYVSNRIVRDLPNSRIKWQSAKKDFGNFVEFNGQVDMEEFKKLFEKEEEFEKNETKEEVKLKEKTEEDKHVLAINEGNLTLSLLSSAPNNFIELDKKFFIFKRELNAYWAENNFGYTKDIKKARKFTALEIFNEFPTENSEILLNKHYKYDVLEAE